PPIRGPRIAAADRELAEAHLALGFAIPALGHPDIPALDVLAVVLGQGESSRLGLSVVREGELASGASAYLHTLRQAGLFVVGATVAPRRVGRAAAAVGRELAGATAGRFDDAEVAKAIHAIEADAVFQRES